MALLIIFFLFFSVIQSILAYVSPPQGVYFDDRNLDILLFIQQIVCSYVKEWKPVPFA